MAILRKGHGNVHGVTFESDGFLHPRIRMHIVSEYSFAKDIYEVHIYLAAPGSPKWIPLHINHPHIYEALCNYDSEPLKTLCKVNGWGFPEELFDGDEWKLHMALSLHK